MKDFDGWNEIKKKINNRETVNVKTGSVWLCNLGLNVGYEIDGKDQKSIRPVLVLIGFGKNGGIALPLTTSNKKSKFLIRINNKSSVNITQIKYLDSRRFYRLMYFLNRKDLLNIIFKVKKLF